MPDHLLLPEGAERRKRKVVNYSEVGTAVRVSDVVVSELEAAGAVAPPSSSDNSTLHGLNYVELARQVQARTEAPKAKQLMSLRQPLIKLLASGRVRKREGRAPPLPATRRCRTSGPSSRWTASSS